MYVHGMKKFLIATLLTPLIFLGQGLARGDCPVGAPDLTGSELLVSVQGVTVGTPAFELALNSALCGANVTIFLCDDASALALRDDVLKKYGVPSGVKLRHISRSRKGLGVVSCNEISDESLQSERDTPGVDLVTGCSIGEIHNHRVFTLNHGVRAPVGIGRRISRRVRVAWAIRPDGIHGDLGCMGP